jgi:hydrogenase maturation protease
MPQRRYRLIIGYGNSLRRDDGAGLILAERLAAAWEDEGHNVRHILVQQLTPDLAYDITAHDVEAVIFADARFALEESDQERRKIRIEAIPQSFAKTGLGHDMDAAELMTYGELLYRRRPPAWMVTVAGSDFSFGEGLSSDVAVLLTHDKIVPLATELDARINRQLRPRT